MNLPEPEKPQGLTDEHLVFLDDLREDGVTNMLGAAPYLQEEFGLDKKTAGTYLLYWMKTFSKRKGLHE